jgi:hypothetical protein
MKLISWDVGIKNLAYCIIDYDLNNKNKNILHWNIINLIDDNEHCYISSCKRAVIKSCTYYEKNIFWCEKHESIYNTLLNKENNNNNVLSKPTSIKHINCLNINVDVLRASLINKLDIIILPLIYSEKINYVIIENQPAMRNPRMKAIADTLYCWTLIRGINDSRIIKSIHLISPSNKLKQYAEELMNAENKYKSTKLKSIEVVNEYFTKNKMDIWKNYLNEYIKKDDLCDTLLQGFYWIDRCIDETNKINERIKKQKNKKVKSVKSVKNKKLIDNVL